MQMESEVPVPGPAGQGQAGSERVSAVLVPRLLALFGSPYEDAKCLAVSIMNLLAGGAPSALADHMDKCALFHARCALAAPAASYQGARRPCM